MAATAVNSAKMQELKIQEKVASTSKMVASSKQKWAEKKLNLYAQLKTKPSLNSVKAPLRTDYSGSRLPSRLLPPPPSIVGDDRNDVDSYCNSERRRWPRTLEPSLHQLTHLHHCQSNLESSTKSRGPNSAGLKLWESAISLSGLLRCCCPVAAAVYFVSLKKELVRPCAGYKNL